MHIFSLSLSVGAQRWFDKEGCTICKKPANKQPDVKVVVGMVLCVISLLTIYMAFLHLLDPWITKRRQTAYKQHAEEEVGQLFLPSTIILLRKKKDIRIPHVVFLLSLITIIDIANFELQNITWFY